MASKKIKTNKKTKSSLKQLEIAKDILALLTIALAVFLLLALLNPEASGITGEFTASGLRYLFGAGAYFFPLALIIYGTMLLFQEKKKVQLFLYGYLIAFLATLTLIAILRIPEALFDAEKVKASGGFVGSIFAYPFLTLFGKTGSFILLGAVYLISILFFIGKPFAEILKVFKESKVEKPETKEKPAITKIITQKEKRKPVVEAPEVTQPIEFVQEEQDEETETEPIKPSKTEFPAYRLPPITLLNKKSEQMARTVSDLRKVVETTLTEFKIPARVIGTQEGPTVTTFEVQLEPGVSVKKLTSLERDISLALANPNVRIITPIPGKSAIGIEVPNKLRELVTLRELLETEQWQNSKDPLFLAIGKSSTGTPYFYSLRKMPHMLIAGATGSGKSVCLNSIILTILFKAHPSEVKLLLIDPKRVEFSPYKDIPHLLAPVVVDPNRAASALAYMVQEMERRYQALSQIVARDIDSYNKKASQLGLEPLPYIVVIIDELADLMLVCSKEVEDSIVRLAQMARAVGIHLIVATQRPSADIITGLIKSNITTRIAFSVRSQVDSRVILDSAGAEKLIGQGDMLFLTQSLLHPVRLQAPYVSEEEIEKVTSFVKSQARPEYVEEVFQVKLDKSRESDYDDELLDEAVDVILTYGQASTSFLQRRLKIGYARAARIMDILESRGIVGPQEGSKPREILITREEWERIKEKD